MVSSRRVNEPFLAVQNALFNANLLAAGDSTHSPPFLHTSLGPQSLWVTRRKKARQLKQELAP